MKTPLHRIVLYVAVVNKGGGYEAIEDVKHALENSCDGYCMVKAGETKTIDAGEWSDSHPFNFTNVDAEKEFKALEEKQ